MFNFLLLSLVCCYNFTLESKTYYDGTILSTYDNSCLSNCQSICNTDIQCSRFMLTTSTLNNRTQCITMSVMTSSCFNTTYDTYTKQYNYEFVSSVNYPFGDIKRYDSTTISGCQTYCNQYLDCVAIAFRKYTTTDECYIKHTLIEATKSTNDLNWDTYIRQYEPNSTSILSCSTISTELVSKITSSRTDIFKINVSSYSSTSDITTSVQQIMPNSIISIAKSIVNNTTFLVASKPSKVAHTSTILNRLSNPQLFVIELTLARIALISLRVLVDIVLFIFVMFKTPFKREAKKMWSTTASKTHS